MDLIGTDSYASEGVRAVARALQLEEEHLLIEREPSPAALICRCVYQLAQVAGTIAQLDAQIARRKPMLEAGAGFTWLAASALTAIARIHPDMRKGGQLYAKSALLARLDGEVARETYYRQGDLDPSYWLATVAALFTDIAAGAAELEGGSPVLCDVPATDDLNHDEIAEGVANALGLLAAAATNAAEWFAEASRVTVAAG